MDCNADPDLFGQQPKAQEPDDDGSALCKDCRFYINAAAGCGQCGVQPATVMRSGDRPACIYATGRSA